MQIVYLMDMDTKNYFHLIGSRDEPINMDGSFIYSKFIGTWTLKKKDDDT